MGELCIFQATFIHLQNSFPYLCTCGGSQGNILLHCAAAGLAQRRCINSDVLAFLNRDGSCAPCTAHDVAEDGGYKSDSPEQHPIALHSVLT